MENKSWGRIIFATILALILGLCASGLALSSGLAGASAALLLLISPMCIAFLYGLGGLIPAGAMIVSMEAGAAAAFGGMWPVYLLLAVALPGAAMVAFSRAGWLFFRQLRAALAAQAAGLLLALGLLFLRYGPDLGGAAADALNREFAAMDAGTRGTLANWLAALYGQFGLVLEGTADEILSSLVSVFEDFIKVNVPTMLISLVALNAPLGVLWCNYLRARRGEAGVSYISLSGWRLPASTVLGLLMCFIATYLLTYTGRSECILVFYAVETAVCYAATAQAGASILSRMKKAGTSAFRRNALFIAMCLFLNVFLIIYGVVSALFGSQGLFTAMIKAQIEKKRRDKGDN